MERPDPVFQWNNKSIQNITHTVQCTTFIAPYLAGQVKSCREWGIAAIYKKTGCKAQGCNREISCCIGLKIIRKVVENA